MKTIETTGQLRQLLADTAAGLLGGEIEIHTAETVHKLAKVVAELIDVETRSAWFQKDSGGWVPPVGALKLGDPKDA